MMVAVEETRDRDRCERWFVRRGLPHLIDDYTANFETMSDEEARKIIDEFLGLERALADETKDVLLVNDSSGDGSRKISLKAPASISITMAAPVGRRSRYWG